MKTGPGTMKILALDPATHTGWCWGETDSAPKSGWVDLRPNKGDPASLVPYRLMGFLRDVGSYGLPDLIVYEEPIAIGALTKFDRPQNEETAKMPYYLESAIFIWCIAKNVEFRAVHQATYRAHFLGKGRKTDPSLSKDKKRLELKKLMLERAKLLGYIGKDRFPTRADASDGLYDQADACGLWDYAAATWGKRIERELHMFGEQAAS